MPSLMFEKILNDTTNGSTDILIKFLEFIRKINPSLEDLLVYIDDLKKQYYEMLVIRNGIDKLWNLYKKFNNIQEATRILQNEITLYNIQILQNLKDQVDAFDNKTFLTISNSLTLQFVLQGLDCKNIYIMRSEPGGEGLFLWDKIENSQLIEDDVAKSLIEAGKIDMVLMGCDAFKPGDQFINKIGSLQLCETAAVNNIPVYILTNSLKETEKLPRIKSKIFERIPITSNVHIITENK